MGWRGRRCPRVSARTRAHPRFHAVASAPPTRAARVGRRTPPHLKHACSDPLRASLPPRPPPIGIIRPSWTPSSPPPHRYQPAKLDALISEGLAPHSQLTTSDPRRHRYLACGLLLRGDATASDAHRALSQAKPQLSLPWWNPDAFKMGLCAAPPVGQPHALLALSNNCATAGILEAMVGRFDQLYRRGAHVHHFTRCGARALFETGGRSADGKGWRESGLAGLRGASPCHGRGMRYAYTPCRQGGTCAPLAGREGPAHEVALDGGVDGGRYKPSTASLWPAIHLECSRTRARRLPPRRLASQSHPPCPALDPPRPPLCSGTWTLPASTRRERVSAASSTRTVEYNTWSRRPMRRS